MHLMGTLSNIRQHSLLLSFLYKGKKGDKKGKKGGKKGKKKEKDLTADR